VNSGDLTVKEEKQKWSILVRLTFPAGGFFSFSSERGNVGIERKYKGRWKGYIINSKSTSFDLIIFI
jgi:hypothetical protein